MNLEKIIKFQDYIRFQVEFSLFCKEKYQCITSFNHTLSSVQLTKDDKNIICNIVIGGVILLIQRFYSENRISKALEISPRELSKIIKKLRNKTCAILDKEELKINPSSFLKDTVRIDNDLYVLLKEDKEFSIEKNPDFNTRIDSKVILLMKDKQNRSIQQILYFLNKKENLPVSYHCLRERLLILVRSKYLIQTADRFQYSP